MFSCATVYDLWQGRAYEGDWVVCLQSSKFGNIYHLSQFWVAFIGLRNLSLQAQLKALPFADGSSLKLHLVDYQWFLKCSIVISCNDILTVSMWCATELFGKNKPAVLVQLLSPPPPQPALLSVLKIISELSKRADWGSHHMQSQPSLLLSIFWWSLGDVQSKDWTDFCCCWGIHKITHDKDKANYKFGVWALFCSPYFLSFLGFLLVFNLITYFLFLRSSDL